MNEVFETKTITVEHGDGWGYDIIGYDDSVAVKYFEYREAKKKYIGKTLTLLPGEFAKSFAKAIIEVNKG